MVNTGGHRWPGGKLHAGDVPGCHHDDHRDSHADGSNWQKTPLENAPYVPPDLRPIATRGGGGGGGEAGSPWSGQPVACSDCHQELMTMM